MTGIYIEEGWIVSRDKSGISTHRHLDSIVEFGDYSLLNDGLTITLDDGNNETIDVFLTTKQLDEIYGKLTCRQNAQIVRKGYKAIELRLQQKKNLFDFLES